METEDGLFFSVTGKCTLCFPAFISWDISVRGSCRAWITPPLTLPQRWRLMRRFVFRLSVSMIMQQSSSSLHLKGMFVAVRCDWRLFMCRLLYLISEFLPVRRVHLDTLHTSTLQHLENRKIQPKAIFFYYSFTQPLQPGAFVDIAPERLYMRT